MRRASSISLVVEEPGWKERDLNLARIRTAALRALRFAPDANVSPKVPARSRGATPVRHLCRLTILLANDERLRALNLRFRGRDAPTNVLSFPAADTREYLGDVAIALGVAEREAATAGVTILAHTLHLVVHGVLHLLGYDHARAREARTMERLEAAILAEFGIPSPYALAAAAE